MTNNKVPYSLTFKYFNDTITLKKDSPMLRISDVMEMNRSIVVGIFGERAYHDYFLEVIDQIYEYGDTRGIEVPIEY
jgi:hypothetical protein